MPMHYLIEHSDSYLKTYGSLWKYYRDEPHDTAIVISKSFIRKMRITGKTPAAVSTKDVEIAVPLNYLSNFWGTLEMPLTNCEINLTLTWSAKCTITNAIGGGTFTITDTKLYVPLVTFLTLDNATLLQKLKSGFKRTIY